MQTSVVGLRRYFILMYGRDSFEAIASAFVDVQGDCSQVSLSSIPAWHEFAASLSVVPRSDLVPKVFLWCVRHNQPLRVIDRPALPVWLEQINDSASLHKIVVRNPFAIAASPNAFRCARCFDNAARLAMRISSLRVVDGRSYPSREEAGS